MTHLGERAADLVDGQLTPEAAEEATRHLAGCPGCRHEVDAARLVKSRLAGMSDPRPTQDLMARLVGMGGPAGPVAPRPDPMPQGWRPVPVTLPPRMTLVGQRQVTGRRPMPLAAALRAPSRGFAVTVGALSLASVGVFAFAGTAGGPEPVPVPGRTVAPVANLVVPVGLNNGGGVGVQETTTSTRPTTPR